jgi:hypothetical protein
MNRSSLNIKRAEKLVFVSSAAKVANRNFMSSEEVEVELLCSAVQLFMRTLSIKPCSHSRLSLVSKCHMQSGAKIMEVTLLVSFLCKSVKYSTICKQFCCTCLDTCIYSDIH